MIKCNGSHVELRGPAWVLKSEITVALRGLYEAFKEECGEEYANESLVTIGRLAVASEEELEEMLAEEMAKAGIKEN